MIRCKLASIGMRSEGSGVLEVFIAMALFVGSHVLIARTGVKAWTTAQVGRRAYLTLYSLLSIGMMAWVVIAILRAERITLWDTPAWAYPFAIFVTAIGFALIGAGAATPNPISVAFRGGTLDPERPSIVGVFRHPIVWGLGLWGLAHIPSNGDWPSLFLFAGSALFAAIGTVALDRRYKRQLGVETWLTFAKTRPGIRRSELIGGLALLVLWLGLLMAHPWLFNADPLAQWLL